MTEIGNGHRFEVFTLFPPLLNSFLGESILKKAIDRGLIAVNLHNIRDYAADRHRTCDATPYGGGGGMVLKPEPVYAAVEHVLGGDAGVQDGDVPVILLSPQGRLLTQEIVADLCSHRRLALICGRYEGLTNASAPVSPRRNQHRRLCPERRRGRGHGGHRGCQSPDPRRARV